MEIQILCLAELRGLIESRKRSLNSLRDGNMRCVCTTDVILGIEVVKKTRFESPEWRHIRGKTSHFHSASESGYVFCIDLDNYALTEGLFEISDDYRKINLWELAANRHINPEDSSRLICLKYFDECCGTALYSGALTTYYGT